MWVYIDSKNKLLIRHTIDFHLIGNLNLVKLKHPKKFFAFCKRSFAKKYNMQNLQNWKIFLLYNFFCYLSFFAKFRKNVIVLLNTSLPEMCCRGLLKICVVCENYLAKLLNYFKKYFTKKYFAKKETIKRTSRQSECTKLFASDQNRAW